MKKVTLLYLAILFELLTVVFLSVSQVSAQSDFEAFLGQPVADYDIDGIIGSEWADAGNYGDVAFNPTGTGELWVKQDSTYVYIGVRFTADSDNPWVALMLGEAGCMPSNTDGALFGHDSYSANGYRDISFGGLGSISIDQTQDGKGAINVETSNIVTVELKKPLNSGDSEGKDVAWMEDNAYLMIVMWDSDGGGSSGGSANHRTGSPTERALFINSSVIPEFPGLILLGALVAVVILVVFYKRTIRIQ